MRTDDKQCLLILMREAAKEGFLPHSVDDGGDRVEVTSEREAIQAIGSVDDSTVYFRKDGDPKRRRECVVVILGNRDYTTLADASCGREDWDRMLERVHDLCHQASVTPDAFPTE